MCQITKRLNKITRTYYKLSFWISKNPDLARLRVWPIWLWTLKMCVCVCWGTRLLFYDSITSKSRSRKIRILKVPSTEHNVYNGRTAECSNTGRTSPSRCSVRVDRKVRPGLGRFVGCNRSRRRSSRASPSDAISGSCNTTWRPVQRPVRLPSCASPVCSGTRFSPVSRTAADSWRSRCASTATGTCCWRTRVPVPTADCWWTPSWSSSNSRSPCRSRRYPAAGSPLWRILQNNENLMSKLFKSPYYALSELFYRLSQKVSRERFVVYRYIVLACAKRLPIL